MMMIMMLSDDRAAEREKRER